jgi:hypothetical protein
MKETKKGKKEKREGREKKKEGEKEKRKERKREIKLVCGRRNAEEKKNYEQGN